MQLLEALVPRSVIGFCYHTVSDRALPHVRSLYRWKSVAQFKRDLEFLRRSYRVIGYEELEKSRMQSRGKKPCVVITFDDGLAECHDVVRPVLLEYGMPAIFFVTTDFLDNRRLFYRQKIALCIDAYAQLSPAAAAVVRKDVGLIFGAPLESSAELLARLQSATWNEEPAIEATCDRLGVDTGEFLRTVRPYLTSAQVRALASAGFTIGAHGTSHQMLGMMSEPDAEADILTACDAVSELVPASLVPFAFPFSGHDVNRDMLRSVRESNPQVGLFFDSRQLAPDREFIVNRLVVDDPKGATTNGSNLPARLRRAYGRELVRPLVRARARRR
jgi:peptidoglycan/xylan/chitin deacetylase (PgdA/CDA1 family)